MSAAEHQVVHDLSGPYERPYLPPLEGPVEVALVVRCTLFRHERGRNCNGLAGRAIYQPLQTALCSWFEANPLRLPALATCLEQWEQRKRISRKRPRTEVSRYSSLSWPQF